MSDDIVTEPSADSPEFSGQVGAEGVEASEGVDNIFDVSSYADHKVPIKVDGEEMFVPLSEAVAGYQRQADYTRKTQELAQQREQMQFAAAIQEALQVDPAGTIQLLQQHYGATAQNAEPEVPEFADPMEQQMWEINQKVEQIEQFRAEQELQAEIARLQQKYEDFDPRLVVLEALKSGSENLEATYKQMAFDKLYQQVKTKQEADQVLTKQEQQILEAKRGAAIVSGGMNSSASAQDQVGPIGSVRDAWEAAKRSLGGF